MRHGAVEILQDKGTSFAEGYPKFAYKLKVCTSFVSETIFFGKPPCGISDGVSEHAP
jgi:hypothetical protein